MQQAPTYVWELFAVTKVVKHNVVADALSRQFHTDDNPDRRDAHILLAISSPVPLLISQLQQYFASEMEGKEYITHFCNNVKFKDQSVVKNGLLYFQGRLVIPIEQL